MPWTSLESRLERLPLVIAGPILRRTEAQSVSVWIACKKSENLQLIIQERQDDGSWSTVLRGTDDTVALGQHLHVGVVTADTPTNPGAFLTSGRIYQYNVIFQAGHDLSSPGILNSSDSTSGAIDKLTYGDFSLPSFMLPADEIGDLKLVHGSCRKSHGGKTDALQALDTILERTHDDVSQRPQQLFFTGDQIYADDVADVLLFMLIDAAKALLGWDEPLLDILSDEQAPGNRQQALEKYTHKKTFTSGEAKSHLMKLGEYYAMYLFNWSPELWPDPDDPDAWPKYSDDNGDDKVVFPGRDTHFKSSYLGMELPTPHHCDFLKERAKVKSFAQSLPLVRKILANIPSYMIFDDHEVTDDWFLNQLWSQHALDGNLSRRIIQNGLAAYAVCQAWGNRPEEFESGNLGHTVLQDLEALNNTNGSLESIWDRVGNAMLPDIVPHGDNYKLDGGLRWDFRITFPAYDLVVLDSRTRRGFASSEGPPNLLDSTAKRNG